MIRAENEITLTRVDDGSDGNDGYSPTATVTKSGDTATITITDKNGTTIESVSDGADGTAGVSVTSVKTQYYLSTSDAQASGGSWSDTPQAFVSGKYYWTRDYITYSNNTVETSTPVYNRGLTYACEYAESASDAADNASEYAARALGNLSTVQSVTETLNWIAQHGTMALTTDVALDPTHVYFVVDAGGDYVVGGVTYAVVTEPDVADIGTYYELTIDESLNNYVGTHLALDSEGLWLLPASNGTNKVLVATGAGSTYTTAGTFIIDSAGDIVASFRANGATIGISDGSESYLSLDYHSMQMIDTNGNTYFYVSDLRDADGYAEITQQFTGNGSNKEFTLPFSHSDPSGYSATVEVDGVSVAYTWTAINVVKTATAPSDGSEVVITYKTQDQNAKGYTFGFRQSNSEIGAMSVVEGNGNIASGIDSHAEGYQTKATNHYAHASGLSTEANGTASQTSGLYTIARKTAQGAHANGYYTIASAPYSFVMGKYNIEEIRSDGNYKNVFVIGNGANSSSRANAFVVQWDGNVLMGLNTTAESGTTDGDLYAAITALGWQSDVIV